jgi:hypothetical protein
MSEQADIHTVELTDDELNLIRAALHSFLDDFSYKQKDVIVRIKALLAKLPDAEDDEDPPPYGSSRVPTLEEGHRPLP